jgi:two-component system LytT family sensor kinase
MSLKSMMRSPLFLATIAIWFICFTFWTLAAAVDHGGADLPKLPEIALRGITCDILGALCCGLAWLALRTLKPQAIALRMSVAVILITLGTAAYMAWTYTIYRVILPMFPPDPNWLAARLDTVVAVAWTYLSWCGVYFALGFNASLRSAEAMTLDAQSRMLRYQLDPHFLFNILNALATLIHVGRNEDAEETVHSLSNFLRRSFEKDPTARVPLIEEFVAMREYMSVEAVRFGERLTFIEEIDQAVCDALAPSFILQPLLENSIKHGLGQSTRPITIELGAARDGTDLKLWVQDDGDGGAAPARANLGVGLENVRQRLATLYGKGAHVRSEPCLPHGFRVTLTLPLAFT